MEALPCMTITPHGRVQVVTFTRDIFDAELLEQVLGELRALVDQADQPRVVLNFIHLRHAGSNFLGLVMDVTLKVHRKEGRMRVCHMTPQVRDLFALTRLDQMVPIHETLEAALADLSGQAV